MTRRHYRIFHPNLLRVINGALSTIRQHFSSELNQIRAVLASRFFRICGLPSGNEIAQVIATVDASLRAARKYKRSDSVPLGEFVLRMREPIHLHPAFMFGTREAGGRPVFGFEVDLAGDLDLLA